MNATYITKAEVDAIVYRCRQAGADTTYDIVQACIKAILAAQPATFDAWYHRKTHMSREHAQIAFEAGADSVLVRQGEAALLKEAHSALLWMHRRLPAAYHGTSSVESTIESVAHAVGADAHTFIADDKRMAARPSQAASGQAVAYLWDQKADTPWTEEEIRVKTLEWRPLPEHWPNSICTPLFAAPIPQEGADAVDALLIDALGVIDGVPSAHGIDLAFRIRAALAQRASEKGQP